MDTAKLLEGISHNPPAQAEIVSALNAKFLDWNDQTKLTSTQIGQVIDGLGILGTKAKQDAFMYTQTVMCSQERIEYELIHTA